MLDAMEQKPKISEDVEDAAAGAEEQFSLAPLPSEFVNTRVGDHSSEWLERWGG